MKISPASLAAALPAIAFLSCSPSNRYIESASTKRLPHGFAPILRNDDEKAGLERNLLGNNADPIRLAQ
jgi:hypothetical protein